MDRQSCLGDCAINPASIYALYFSALDIFLLFLCLLDFYLFMCN